MRNNEALPVGNNVEDEDEDEDVFLDSLPYHLMLVSTENDENDDGILVYQVTEDETTNNLPSYLLIGKTTEECWRFFKSVESGTRFKIIDSKTEAHGNYQQNAIKFFNKY